jgi:hypothetical protein
LDKEVSEKKLLLSKMGHEKFKSKFNYVYEENNGHVIETIDARSTSKSKLSFQQ